LRRYDWDDAKAQSNFRKHGIRFEQAILVFDDPLARFVQDRVVDGEERWQVIGMAGGCLMAVVTDTYQEIADMEIVRIINARPPTKNERRLYEHSWPHFGHTAATDG